jgi:hypothetical protein
MSPSFLDGAAKPQNIMFTRTPSTSALLSSAKLNISPEQQTDVYNGFLEGSHLKKYVPDLSDCSANLTSVVNALRQTSEDFSKSNITFRDVADGILNIGVAIQGVANATKSCSKLPDTFRVIINYFHNISNDPINWINSVYANAMNNSRMLMIDLLSVQQAVQDQKYYDVGQKIGDIARLVFSIDKVSARMMFFLKNDGNETNFKFDPDRALACGQKVLDVANKAWPVLTDMVVHPDHIITDLSVLAGFVEEIKEACTGVFNLERLKANLVRLYSRIFRTNLLVVGKNPAIGDVIACIISAKPAAVDIFEALVAFSKKDQDTAVQKISQLAIHGPPFYESCNKVILTLISKLFVLILIF